MFLISQPVFLLLSSFLPCVRIWCAFDQKWFNPFISQTKPPRIGRLNGLYKVHRIRNEVHTPSHYSLGGHLELSHFFFVPWIFRIFSMGYNACGICNVLCVCVWERAIERRSRVFSVCVCFSPPPHSSLYLFRLSYALVGWWNDQVNDPLWCFLSVSSRKCHEPPGRGRAVFTHLPLISIVVLWYYLFSTLNFS